MVLDTRLPLSFITNVSTVKRDSNQLSTIKLRVVCKDGFLYLTRRNKSSSWYKNLLKNQYVEVEIENGLLQCEASEVVNKEERVEISRIKFNDEKKYEDRYGFKLTIKNKIEKKA
tara:strand:- start:496 stop:840 length:345 start_codon:yes stop_codon:yes gene_type:complete